MSVQILTKLGGLLLMIFLLEKITSSTAKKEIKILETYMKTSDPRLMEADIDISTEENGMHSINGKFFVKQDVLSDDLLTDWILYSKKDKDDVESKEVFSLSNLKALDFVNLFYKKYFMQLLSECSNAPQFEDELKTYEGLGNNYTFEDCSFKDFKYIQILPPGYYTATCRVIRKEEPVLDATFSLKFTIENS